MDSFPSQEHQAKIAARKWMHVVNQIFKLSMDYAPSLKQDLLIILGYRLKLAMKN